MPIQVEIVTPQKIAFSGEATEVQAPGFHGEFGVLPDHTFFLSVMRPGAVHIFTAQGTQTFLIGRGFAEAGPTQLTLLTELCEEIDTIDSKAAAASLETAEATMATADPTSGEFAAARHAADLAMARLAMAGR